MRWIKEDSTLQAHFKDFTLYMYYTWMKHLATDPLHATKVANLEVQVEVTKKREAKKQTQSSKTNNVSSGVRFLDIKKRDNLYGENLVGY